MKIKNFEYENNKEEMILVPEIEIDYWHNSAKYAQALSIFQSDKDTISFASKVLPEMILTPSELKSVEIFSINDNGFYALNELLVILMGLQTKKLLAQPKRKKAILEMD